MPVTSRQCNLSHAIADFVCKITGKPPASYDTHLVNPITPGSLVRDGGRGRGGARDLFAQLYDHMDGNLILNMIV